MSHKYIGYGRRVHAWRVSQSNVPFWVQQLLSRNRAGWRDDGIGCYRGRGLQTAKFGDWLIMRKDLSLWVLSNDEFVQHYRLVEEELSLAERCLAMLKKIDEHSSEVRELEELIVDGHDIREQPLLVVRYSRESEVPELVSWNFAPYGVYNLYRKK